MNGNGLTIATIYGLLVFGIIVLVLVSVFHTRIREFVLWIGNNRVWMKTDSLSSEQGRPHVSDITAGHNATINTTGDVERVAADHDVEINAMSNSKKARPPAQTGGS